MAIETSFIARGCSEKQDSFIVSNRDDADYSFIAYASGKDVVVVNSETNAVEQLLMGHSANVNCICWIPNLEEGYVSSLTRRQTELISCSCDGRIVDWMWCDGSWKEGESLEVGELVECVHCSAISDSDCLLFVTTDKRSIIVFQRSTSASWREVIRATSPNPDIYYTSMLCLPLLNLPTPSLLLFLAATDNHVYVSEISLHTSALLPLCQLTGFTNWVSSLSLHFCFGKDSQVLYWNLVAAGQDGYCRVWKVTTQEPSQNESFLRSRSLALASSARVYISLESVIEVAATIVSSVQPHPPVRTPAGLFQPLLLLTSAMDATVKIIAPEDCVEGGGVFSPVATLHPHLIGSQGFFGAYWSVGPHSRELFAYGYHGAMFKWRETIPAEMDHAHVVSFSLLPFVSGHFGPCKAHFSRYGNLVVSSSRDRTVRVWGRERQRAGWEEVSRPVVHGYPVIDAVCLRDHAAEDGECGGLRNEELGRLLTINEEKKCRVYGNTYLNLLVLNTLLDTADSRSFSGKVDVKTLPNTYYWSSYAPELGLSNKGIPVDQAEATLMKYQMDIDAEKGLIQVSDEAEEKEEKEEGETGDAMLLMANDGDLEMLVSLDVLQTINNKGSNTLNESRLCKGMLFTEMSYLYNKYTTNNFISVCYDDDADLVITSTVGSSEEDSVLSVWDNASSKDGSLQFKQYLSGHRSTVVSVTPFTYRTKHYLLSVGKDRQIRVWGLRQDRCYEPEATLMKSHSRIVWSSCFVGECGDDALLATGSRDMTVKVWGFDVVKREVNLRATCSFESAVTAVGSSRFGMEASVLVVGLENGDVIVYRVAVDKECVTLEEKSRFSVGGRVSTIDWIPLKKSPEENRTKEEYFEKSNGNCVIGCENGGVYLYKIVL